MRWVTYEREGYTAIITLNRPERLNAWGHDMSNDIGAAFEQYAADEDARVAILCGAGRSFCAGGDAKEHGERGKPWSKSPQDEMSVLGQGKLMKPVIAAIQGHCLGAGLLLLAMRCDIRIAADNALFGLPEVAVGVVNCEVAICNQSIPLCALMEMTMTADFVDAGRALSWGMINKVVPLENLMNEARQMAARIARNSPVAIQQSKQIILEAVRISEEAKELERQLYQNSSNRKETIDGWTTVGRKQKNAW